jgi:hypothetical protein
MELRNRFQGMNSASLCSLAGRYDNPIPPRFLAPIDCLKIPALYIYFGRLTVGKEAHTVRELTPTHAHSHYLVIKIYFILPDAEDYYYIVVFVAIAFPTFVLQQQSNNAA